MRFIVNSGELLKQLNSINGVISVNPVVPILHNFLFEIDQNVLTVKASDLQTSMITKINVKSSEKGSVAVSARMLLDTLRNLSDQPVTFSIDESTYSVEISSDNGKYKLSGENATDFPRISTSPNDYLIEIPSAILLKAIRTTFFATTSDELRPAMMGVYVVITDEKTLFVSTDGHRLVRYERTDIKSGEGNPVIIPRKAMSLLRAMLPAQDIGDVRIGFSVSNVFFSFRNVQMISRLIDERYPSYNDVIPVGNSVVMSIDRMTFISSLKRVSIYANKTTHQVKLRIKGSELSISAEDLDFSNEATERLACDHEGEDIEIGFNAKSLIDMLIYTDADRIKITMSTPNKAALIYPAEQDKEEDTLMLLMPVISGNTE